MVPLLSNWVNDALVNSNFQLDVGSFNLRVSVFGTSNEITKFPMNLQNSTLEISESLMMSGTQKCHLAFRASF